MAMTYDYITIQASHVGLTPVIEAKQYDSGRGAIVTITDMDLAGKTAEIYVKKPDGTEVYNACTINEQGQVVVPFSRQMLAVVGDSQMELDILDGAELVTSFDIIVRVYASLRANSHIESSDEYGALETLVNDAQNAIANANNAATEATQAAEAANEAAAAATQAAGEAATATAAASTAASAANAAATEATQAASAASAAATRANAAAEAAETAVANLQTQTITLSCDDLNNGECIAKKYGNMVSVYWKGDTKTQWGNYFEPNGLRTALNSLPASWRKGMPSRQRPLFASSGQANGCVQIQNSASYPFSDIVGIYIRPAWDVAQGTEIVAYFTWMVDD